MMRIVDARSVGAAALFVLSIGAAQPAAAVAGAPIGPQFRVNDWIGGQQNAPAVTATPGGRYTVAWMGETPDGVRVLARRFLAGAPVGPEFVVNETFAEQPSQLRVATDRYGSDFVVWEAADGDSSGIWISQLCPQGATCGDMHQRVNYVAEGTQANPSLALDYYGRYKLVAFSQSMGNGHHARATVLDRYGYPQNQEFLLDYEETDMVRETAVAVHRTDRFAAAWTAPTEGQRLTTQIVAQRFQASTERVGDLVLVGTMNPPGAPAQPVMAVTEQQDYVVAWVAGDTIRARRFDSDGELGDAIRVSGLEEAFRRSPAIAVRPDGGFVVTWEERETETGAPLVRARAFGPTDEPLGDPTILYGATNPDAQSGGVAIDDGGDFMGVWADDGFDALDVFAQRFSGGAEIDLAISLYEPTDPVDLGSIHYLTATVANESSVNSTGLASGIVVRIARTGELGDRGPHYDALYPWSCETLPTEHVCRYGDVLPTYASTQPLGIFYYAPYNPTTLTTSVTVSGDQIDPDPSDNEAVETTQVADISPDYQPVQGLTNVEPGAVLTGSPLGVTGLGIPVAIRVVNGEYSLNGAPFTTLDGTASNGDVVRLRHTASTTFGGSRNTAFIIGASSWTFVSWTRAKDTAPDAFAFADVANVAAGTLQTSNAVVVTGFDDATATVAGGEYSVDGAAFRTTPSTVRAGQSVRVRHTSSAQSGTSVSTTLTIGGVADTFTTTTVADTTPDAFAFADATGVARATTVVSNAVAIAGLGAPAPVSVSGGEYSVDGGAFTSAPGTIASGQQVRVRHTSASAFLGRVDTTLTIGGVADTFSSTTEAVDTTPSAFAFADQSGVATGTLVVSAPVTVAGINSPTSISVSGGEYNVDGGPFTTAVGMVASGAQVRVRHTTASGASASVSTTVTIGGVADTFTSTTGTADTTPSAFAFTDVTGAKRSRLTTSNTITVAGINAPVAIGVAGGGAQYAKNGGAWTSVAGTVVAGDRVAVRLTSASASYTAVSAVVTIGGIADTWTVTTGR